MSTSASSADAFSGDPSRAAAASFAAGTVQAVLLLPANTVQTHMQHAGRPMLPTLRGIFASGGLPGVRLLYRALGPTVAMLGVRQGFKFGSGAAVKSRLPTSWPELARDAVSGGSSAVATTTVLFPIDTLKTRWQLGRASPRLPQLYQGFTPAVIYSAFGMSIWLCSRNILERTIPDPGRSSALQHWKHFVCGAAAGQPFFRPAIRRRPARHARETRADAPAGMIVQIPTYPLDTLKKRMQAADTPPPPPSRPLPHPHRVMHAPPRSAGGRRPAAIRGE